MNGQVIDFTTVYAERISNTETELKEVEHKVDDLSEIKETLAVLTNIQQTMIEDNKARDRERRESAKAMSELSLSVKQTTEAVSKLNIKLDANDKKLDGLIADRTEKTEDRKSKRIFWTSIIGSVLTSAVALAVALLTR